MEESKRDLSPTKIIKIMTFIYFTRSNLVPKVFEWDKCKTVHLSKTVVVYELNKGLIWTPMNVKGQGHSVTLAQGH